MHGSKFWPRSRRGVGIGVELGLGLGFDMRLGVAMRILGMGVKDCL